MGTATGDAGVSTAGAATGVAAGAAGVTAGAAVPTAGVVLPTAGVDVPTAGVVPSPSDVRTRAGCSAHMENRLSMHLDLLPTYEMNKIHEEHQSDL